jgi:hypothetical protein
MLLEPLKVTVSATRKVGEWEVVWARASETKILMAKRIRMAKMWAAEGAA